MVICQIEIELEYNLILFQKLWIVSDNSSTISHPSYTTILSDRIDIRYSVAIFQRKLFRLQFCTRSDLCTDSDMLVLDILDSDISDLQLINVYNKIISLDIKLCKTSSCMVK